jgi:magnesium transporter
MKTVLFSETLEQQIRAAIKDHDLDQLSALLTEEHPADIADILDRLKHDDRMRVFRHLPPEQAAEVLSETDVGATRALVHSLTPDEIRILFHQISIDDVVEILGEDLPRERQELLATLEPDEARAIRAMLAYPPRSAGRLMTEAFIRVQATMTGGEVLRLLQHSGQDAENINDLYVLDEQEHLQGVARLRDVLAAPPERALNDILEHSPVTVAPETDQEEVARLVSQYDLLSLPVVEVDQRMLGIVTVDDVLDVLVQEGTEDVLRLGGVQSGATDETYFGVPIIRAIQRRVGWLLLLFLTGIVTVNVLELFEGVLEQQVALSFFIPLLIGTGGNTGAQTVSTIVRSLALEEVRLRDVWRVVGREITGGLLLGILLGIVGFGLTLLLGNTLAVALVVSLTIVAICTWANVMGAVVPLLVRRLGLDPALVSAPLITTLVDATGLTIYMLIAKLVLGL